jgi:hypothetical protein
MIQGNDVVDMHLSPGFDFVELRHIVEQANIPLIGPCWRRPRLDCFSASVQRKYLRQIRLAIGFLYCALLDGISLVMRALYFAILVAVLCDPFAMERGFLLGIFARPILMPLGVALEILRAIGFVCSIDARLAPRQKAISVFSEVRERLLNETLSASFQPQTP